MNELVKNIKIKGILITFVFMLLPILTIGQQIKLEESIRFLALGDSYTIGEGVIVSDRWPVQLKDSLESRGYEFEELKIIARTGWRTESLLSAIENENPSNSFNLVSLLIGVNNQFQGANFEIYPVQFRELLNQAITLCGGNASGVFVLSIPDYGYTPFGSSAKESISEGIDKYNETNKAISGELGITYINITPISREAEEKPEYLASDKLHPSGIMYGQWVNKILQNIKLKERPSSYRSNEIDKGLLFPNPATSDQLSYNSEEFVESVDVYNELGILVLSQNIGGRNQFSLDISILNSGIYYYRISLPDKRFVSGKLVVK